MATVSSVGATGNREIDGLLSGYRWSGVLTYSFTDAANDYGAGYGYGEPRASGFGQISATQQAVMHNAAAQVMNYTNLTMQFAGTNGADIRIAQSSEANPTAYAYYPAGDEGGDIWFGTSYNYRTPKLGDYYTLTHIHELGHSLGLKHAHEIEGPGNTALPSAHDSLEYSVMSYRSYAGQSLRGGYTNETYGYPTTFMMNDIRALQQMYGADFDTNSGDTVYTWSPTTGETFIDGVGQGRPGGASAPAFANVLFMTVWDGDGTDTYDFSSYTTGITVNLNPGAFSVASSTQRALLGAGKSAQGNVYNAYLYDDDERSYIENAVGGGAGDTLIGNAIENRLDGGAGNDTLTGGAGADVFVFRSGYGADIVTDFSIGFDQVDVSELTALDDFAAVMAVASQAGAHTLFNFGISLTLTLQNVVMGALSAADFIFDPSAPVTPNEAPTAIGLGNLAVNENQAGATVGAITVADTDDTAFSFTVSDNRFQVTGTPGAYELKLAPGKSLDYEAAATVDVTVTARDPRGQTVSQNFTLTVNDMAGATITGTEGRDTISAARTVAGQSFATADDDIIDALGGNDIVTGLGGNDQIDGGAGDDTLNGDGGNDRLTGGLGADRLNGGVGDDVFVISGSDAKGDIINGGDGADAIEVTGGDPVVLSRFIAALASIETWTGNGQAVTGTTGTDYLDLSGLQSVSGIAYIDGGAGHDRLVGTSDADDLRGGSGTDLLTGGAGDDTLNGGSGFDTLDGGAGDDTFIVEGADAANDLMRGGAGTDTLQVAGLGSLTLSRFDGLSASIEAWEGNGAGVIGTRSWDWLDFSRLTSVMQLGTVDVGDGHDRLTGSTGDDDLRGGGGNDIVNGHDGDDRLTGGSGADTVDGGAGDDIILLGGADAQSDTMRGGAGLDTIEIAGTSNVTLTRFDAGAASIEAWHGNDAGVIGTRGADSLDFSQLLEVTRLTFIDGGAGNDRLTGSAGADDLRGGVGNDILTGGAGDDILSGGAGNDRFAFEAGWGHDVISDFQAGSSIGDVIAMSNGVFASLDDLLAASQQVGADVVITYDASNSVTLQNVQLGALNANDFNFS